MSGNIVVKRAPPVVGQGSDAKCWAASLESWLRVQVAVGGAQQGKLSLNTTNTFGLPDKRDYSWVRKSASVDELLSTYSDIVRADGSLVNGGSLEHVAADSGMQWKYLDAFSFNRDQLSPLMSTYGHLFIVYFSHSMYHAVVGYGFTDNGVLAMNPKGGGSLDEVKYDFLHEMARVNQKIFVGWPLKGSPFAIDHTVQRYLLGEWHVLIGGWSGYFGFDAPDKVYWRTFDQSVKHQGTWKRDGTKITWQFSDDAPGWVRTFSIEIGADNTIPDRVESSATTPQGTVSYFTMTRTND